MNELKISVIVPIFNAEKYLVKCLDSIVNQSYRNLEIILVNDGSTDSSRTIIEKYEAHDNRIVGIHKENGGIGSAYRVAFEMVKGEYISFIDSDDYIDLSMYEELIKIIADKNPDIIHFGTVVFKDKCELIQAHDTYNLFIEGNDNILHHHFTFLKFPGLGCRLFRKNLFSQIVFFDQNIGIDEMVIVQILSKCNSAVYITKTYYYANAREQSVSRVKYSIKKIYEGIRIHRFICSYFEKNKKKFSPYLYNKYLSYLMHVYDITIDDKDIQTNYIISTLKNDFTLFYHKTKRTNAFISEHWQFKLLVTLFALSPNLFLLYSSSKKNVRKILIHLSKRMS